MPSPTLLGEGKWARYLIPQPSKDELDRWLKTSQFWFPARRILRWFFQQFFRHYTGLHCEGIENVPQSGPFIVVANHSSHFDTGVLMVALAHKGKVHPLAAKDYFFRNKLWSWFFPRFVDVIPFDRHNPSPENLSLAMGVLQRKHSLLFFPEGGRSREGDIQPFKRGVGLLALESGVPVIPAYIKGSHHALPKGSFVPRRHPITVHFAPPLSLDHYLQPVNGDGPLELSRKVTEDIQSAVQALR